MELIDQLCKMAVEKYGSDKQLNMVVEECVELIKAIMKYKRKKHKEGLRDGLVLKIIEEYADVKIVINQLKFIFPYNELIEEILQGSLNSLAYKLGMKDIEYKEM